jgi:hypothetical protein
VHVRDDVEDWLAAHGVEPSAPVETIHKRPWSTVLRVPTSDGDLYLKQEQPVQAYEVLLLRDGGTRVADSRRFELFASALALYGELQVGGPRTWTSCWHTASAISACRWSSTSTNRSSSAITGSISSAHARRRNTSA